MTELTRRFLRTSAGGACLLALALAAQACGAPETPDPVEETVSEAPTARAAETTVPATTFETLEGASISLADLRGSVLVVNFWGTWCVPCRREIPELVELHEIYADKDVEIVGIAVDSGEPADIRSFADGYGVEYRLWLTDMATALADFQSVGYPFTLIVDRDGEIVQTYYGPQTLESLSSEIDALLD